MAGPLRSATYQVPLLGLVPSANVQPSVDETTREFFHHTTAKRVDTDAVIAKSLKRQYPNLKLVIAPSWGVDLLGFASAGFASFTAIDDAGPGLPSSLAWKAYIPPARRLEGGSGALVQDVQFGKFLYKWRDAEFVLYIVDGRDGTSAYPTVRNNYILTSDVHKADSLITAVGRWGNELHEEIWVFDRGGWGKSSELYQSVKKASWDAVILDPNMKKAIINDHLTFFDSHDTYTKLQVPWKRGIIYHGPPGNGKTISIKAMMNTLYSREDPVPTAYVRNFASYMGPEYAISEIFAKARQLAPCYLIFEDLDSLVSDSVRSYFLNEVDGLKGNDGIFMIGSTNHLDRLDPGISKRPSRFDRKYYFPDPDMQQRIAYARFWQRKLADNKNVEFPDELCKAIADITHGFSFAYMQEAFVAALLVIARRGNEAAGDSEPDGFEHLRIDDHGDEAMDWVNLQSRHSLGTSGGEGDDLENLVLWVEIQKQVAILREGMDNEEVRSSRKFEQ